MNLVNSPAVIIACVALSFTVFSFWWMNWRPAKLVLSGIRAIAVGMGIHGASSEKNLVIVTLPLIFSNTGARAIVLDQLRLVPKIGGGLDEAIDAPALSWERADSEMPTFDTVNGNTHDYFALPCIINPKEVKKANFVFQKVIRGFQFKAAIYRYKLEYQPSNSERWIALRDIVLDFRQAPPGDLFNLNTYYRTYHYPYRYED